MKFSILCFFLLLCPLSVAVCQVVEPEPSSTIVRSALETASSSNRTVLVVFHASWCGWCKRLDALLEDASLRRLIGNQYVVARLDVLENGEKAKSLENPGARAMLKELGGEESGLPFYVFLDAHGKKIADSNVMPHGQNIGYPGSTEEIAAFEDLLKKTAPRMNERDRGAIVEYLRRHAPR